MEGPKLTEERLRHNLDSNQVMRERMCLALLPLLGPYTREQPRRPKGGPDGGRDIEAIYQGSHAVWGAVGFRNGGGTDEAARREAEEKFETDLDRALRENSTLTCFVFFTNVDLTPVRIEKLKAHARGKNVAIVDIFDMERLRHVLDSAEGLIARLQYLEIPMSPTEQAALVGKFGNQMQNAVKARFDRVERTLAQMERFLDLQKPILRLDLFVELNQPATSIAIGEEAILLRLHGLHDLSKTLAYLCLNQVGHQYSKSSLLVETYIWSEESPGKFLSLGPMISSSQILITSYSELSLTTGGGRVRIADLTIFGVEAYCTTGLRDKIRNIALDANGYELFSCVPNGIEVATDLKWPAGLTCKAPSLKWVSLLKHKERNLLFSPPTLSGRFSPLVKIQPPDLNSAYEWHGKEATISANL